jgi:hypothetical protein
MCARVSTFIEFHMATVMILLMAEACGDFYWCDKHKDYDRKGSAEKKSGRDPQGAWRQELTGGKLPVVK